MYYFIGRAGIFQTEVGRREDIPHRRDLRAKPTRVETASCIFGLQGGDRSRPELWKAGLMSFIGQEREGSSEAGGGEGWGNRELLLCWAPALPPLLGKDHF